MISIITDSESIITNGNLGKTHDINGERTAVLTRLGSVMAGYGFYDSGVPHAKGVRPNDTG